MPRIEGASEFINPFARNFLLKAIREKAHLTPPPHIPDQEWIEMKNLTGSYVVGPARLEDIGRVYAATRKRGLNSGEDLKNLTAGAVRSRIFTFLEYLYANCSSALQADYPFDQLTLSKRASTHYRLKMSEIKGGVAQQVADQLNQRRFFRTIFKKNDIGTAKQAYKRSRLREMGLSIPTQDKRTAYELERIERPLRRENSGDRAIQAALNRLSMDQYGSLSSETPPVVTTLIKLAYGLGYHIPVRAYDLFLETVQAAQIPLSIKESIVQTGQQAGRVQRRFIVWMEHSKRIQKAFEDNADLEKYKKTNALEILCGPPRRLPPPYFINKLRERLGFIPVTKALRDMGVHRRWNQEGIREFFGTNSPITIIRVYDTFYYHRSQEELLRKFVAW